MPTPETADHEIMKKPTIYLDTNIVSALHYDGTDINGLARRMATRDWWDSERRGFDLFGSIVTEQELADGVYGNQQECVHFVRRLKYVPITAKVRQMARRIPGPKACAAEQAG